MKNGFQSSFGEYPKEEYYNHSSINETALGERVNKLYVGGGDEGVSIPYEEQTQSVFPHNQVKETSSGHIIEIDDTPSGERIMIRHRSGSGIEMKPDGTIVIVSTQNTIQVCDGTLDVIVEGDTNLVYKGDLNVDIEGDYNLNIAGNSTSSIDGNDLRHIKGNLNDTVDGNKTTKVQGLTTLYTQSMFVSSETSLDVTSSTYNLETGYINLTAAEGAIGSGGIDMYGYTMTATTFVGDLNGTAVSAISSNTAGTAGSLGTGSGGHSTDIQSPSNSVTDTIDTVDVSLDLDVDKYNGTFKHHPSLEEVRAEFRTDTSLASVLIEQGILSSSWSNTDYTITREVDVDDNGNLNLDKIGNKGL